MQIQVSKPPHNRYALQSLDNATYTKYACVYADCKRWGVRSIYTYLTGTGLWGVVKEVGKGTLVQYGKRRIATVVITGATYICAPAIAVITNATRVVKSCKVVYTTIGYTMEAIEDSSHVVFLPIDLAIFGQPIPANKAGRFTSWDQLTDVIANLPTLDDES